MKIPRSGVHLCLLALIGLLGLSSQSQALSFDNSPTFEEVAQLSTLAFRGEVVAVRHELITTPRRSVVPYTVYTLVVLRAYRGTTDTSTVNIFQYGGPVGTDEWETLAGLASLRLGDQVAVFSNDSYQFISGTLFGDLGLRRFVQHEGQWIALSASWSAMAEGVDNQEELHECVPDSTSPTLCSAWENVDEHVVTGPLPTGSTGRLVTAQAFDQRMLSLLTPSTTTGPPQMFSEAAFATHLAAFIDHISAPKPLANLPVQ